MHSYKTAPTVLLELKETILELATVEERREMIMSLQLLSQAGIDSGELEEADTGLIETFCNGIYTRQVSLAKGTIAVGEIHKQEHMNIMSQGSALVVTEEGIKEIHAPFTWVGQPGIKRAAFALEDVVWTTIHATTKTTSEEVRAEFVAPTYNDVPRLEE